jgi:DNA-binding protein Fis
MVMEETSGNQSDASKILGINRNTLRKKIRDYKIEVQ